MQTCLRPPSTLVSVFLFSRVFRRGFFRFRDFAFASASSSSSSDSPLSPYHCQNPLSHHRHCHSHHYSLPNLAIFAVVVAVVVTFVVAVAITIVFAVIFVVLIVGPVVFITTGPLSSLPPSNYCTPPCHFPHSSRSQPPPGTTGAPKADPDCAPLCPTAQPPATSVWRVIAAAGAAGNSSLRLRFITARRKAPPERTNLTPSFRNCLRFTRYTRYLCTKVGEYE